MEYKEVISILTKLIENPGLSPDEKKAIETAIGMLSWGTLAQSRQKIQKAKRDKSKDW